MTLPVEAPQLEQDSSTVAGGIIGIEPTGFLGPECKSFMLSDLSSVEAEACWPPQASAPKAQSAQLNEFWALRTGQSLSMHRQLGRHADEFDAPILLLNADDTLLEPVVGYP